MGCTLWAPSAFSKTPESDSDSPKYYWFNGDKKEEMVLVPNEITIFLGTGGKVGRSVASDHVSSFDPNGEIVEHNDLIIRFRVPEKLDPETIRERCRVFSKQRNAKHISPTFRTGPEGSNTRRILTGEIIVHFKSDWNSDRVQVWGEKRGLKVVKKFSFAPGTYLFSTGESGFRSLEIANEIYLSGDVKYAYPNWFKSMELRSVPRATTPNDPLFSSQWHLNNTGQGGCATGEDVNIQTVWDTFKGSVNEVVAITDSGLEIGHEDISPNVISGLSHDFVSGDSDPTPNGSHGTSVGGVVGARGNNNKGVAGAAFNTGLVGYRLIEGGNTDSNEADAMTRNKGTIDINNNSWGPSDNGSTLEGGGSLFEAALLDGTSNGRGGKGILYLWAGGNGKGSGDNSNYDGYANSRYTIAVAASTCGGTQASYSEPGANIVVASPSNGGFQGIFTTDATGSGNTLSNYTSSFGGTSSATPLVSGILALVLQANPSLGWRDVIRLLVTTSEKIDPTDSDWTTNGAGHNINHKYGFGRIDAGALVSAAQTTTSFLSTETTTTASSTVNQTIPDNNTTGVSNSITVSDNLAIEYVDVIFDATHTFRGDLKVVLTSPAGTESVLAEQHGDSGNNYSSWRFGTIRHYDETSSGTWTLKVTDEAAEDTGTFNSWSIKIYGRATSSATSTPTATLTATTTPTSTPTSGPTPTPTPTPNPQFTPTIQATIPTFPTVGLGTPTPFATIAFTTGDLANISIQIPGGEFDGVLVNVGSVASPPSASSGIPLEKTVAIQISELSGCQTGITVSIPVPSGVMNPALALFINGVWQNLSTTVSGGIATAFLTCSQLSSASATSKNLLGIRAASDVILVGITELSTLFVPSMGPQAMIILAVFLTVFLVRRDWRIRK